MVCPACLAIPFMVAGAGTGVAGKGVGMTWILLISIILTLIGLYLMFIQKKCGSSKCGI